MGEKLPDKLTEYDSILESYFNAMVDLPPFLGQPMTIFLNILTIPDHVVEHIMELINFGITNNPKPGCGSKVNVVDFKYDQTYDSGRGGLLMVLHFQQNNKALSTAATRIGMCFLINYKEHDTH